MKTTPHSSNSPSLENDVAMIGAQQPVILVVDPDEHNMEQLRELFDKEGWETISAKNPDEALSIYFEVKPDLIVLDAAIEEKNGYASMKAMREHAKSCLVPLIVTSLGSNKQLLRLRNFSFGANDFLEKPFSREELIVRVKRQLELHKRIGEVALIDMLAGCFNHQFFSMEMKRQISDLRRSREPFTLVLMDMDQTRAINAEYGYEEGDRWIRELGQFVLKRIRNSDVLARIHTDRFALILPRTYAENALSLVQRLQNEFAQIVLSSGNGYTRTFSAGLLEVIDEEWSEEKCLQMAGAALQDAKKAGGHVSQIFRIGDIQQDGWKRHLNIAIVEDDNLIRNLLEKRLGEFGGPELVLEIRSFLDGEYFFEDEWHKSKGQFLVILDRNMPRMNGMEVVRKLRSNYDRSRYQILMLTAVNSEESISRAIEAGVDDYMTKPFSLIELESRILRLIKGKKR